MSDQLDALTADVASLGTKVDALIAKPAAPPVTVPEDLSAVTAAVVAISAKVDAALAS